MENKKSFLNKRSLKYGSNSIILIAAVIVIAILANVLVGMADLKLDLTSNKLYSLSDVTKKQLKNLKQDVEITGLFDEGKTGSGSVPENYSEVTKLLNLYSKYSHVKVRYVDPDKNPTIIKELDPSNTMDLQTANFVIKSTVNGKVKRKKLEYYDLFATQTDESTYQTTTTGSNAEQGFTGAIKYVTSTKTPVVYFVTGHKEIDADSEYSQVKSYLEKNNYTTNKLNLVTTAQVPKDAELLIIAAPKSDLTISERTTLENYFDYGGKAIFMFDYLASDPSFDQFNNLLGEFNVAVDYDKVKETDGNKHLPNDEYSMVMNVSSSNIIPTEFNALLSNSRSIRVLKNKKEYITTTPLMSTGSGAIGEMVNKSRGADQKGPLDIAVAVENKGGDATSKILVIGNASFIGDTFASKYQDYYNNGLIFFLQSMSWMIDKQDEVIVPTKNYETNQIQITQTQAQVMGGVVVVVFPLLILCTGLVVFLRRRHL